MANIYELQVAFSKTAQSDIDTASTDLMRVNTTSNDIGDLEPLVEDDADEIGKGHEFAEDSILVGWKSSKKIGCYLSSEMLAIAAAYGLGNGSAGTYTPIDPTSNTNGIELPWMTVLEGVRKGGGSPVLNRDMLGMVMDKFRISLTKGPGKANSKIEMDLVGTGRYTDPSVLDMPAKTTVHRLGAESLTCSINGVDYVTAKNFESFDFEWDNAVRAGYFPGSGYQTSGDPTSGQVQGRMEFGKRTVKASFVARFVNGSTELATLSAQTIGTAVLTLAGASGHDATITMHQTRFKTTKLDNSDGVLTVKVDISGQYDATNGVVTMVVNNALGTVGRA